MRPSLRQVRRNETEQRRRRWVRRLVLLFLMFGLIWVIGLVAFVTRIPRGGDVDTTTTDAAVVLTGGSERLEAGLELLANGHAKKLLISGVNKDVDLATLLGSLEPAEIPKLSPETIACCIALGYSAEDTRGNAVETADWMRQQKFKSIRLITAAYHMPRSMLEFHRAMPGVQVLPYPVFPRQVRQEGWWRWPGTTNLLVREYNKYLVALLRGLVLPGDAGLAPVRP
ncbi:YdcF family protein [Hypericibacter sp.]|uniref:YdcF family protein n=1 Tax=Hypericibacter sp. TaxID=2705401 RepID=UPI003D6CFE28